MHSEKQLAKSLSFSNTSITKPFFLKPKIPHNINPPLTLYSVSHIYLHTLAFDYLKISWGSEVAITNPKNNKVEKVYAFSTENNEQNCIEMGEELKNKLELNEGMCVMVTSYPRQKMIQYSDISGRPNINRNYENQFGYAYEKNQFYELIAKILNHKLKIQLKVLKYLQSPKLYYLELDSSFRQCSLVTLFRCLQSQQNYYVSPHKAIIQVIPIDNDPIMLKLQPLRQPKTIDTEVIMSLLQQMQNNRNNNEIHRITQERSEKMIDDSEIDPNYTNKPAKSYQKTYCETYGKTEGGDSDLEAVLEMKKIATQFRTQNTLPKHTFSFDPDHTSEIKKMHEKIKKLNQHIEELQTQIVKDNVPDKNIFLEDQEVLSLENRLDRQCQSNQSFGIANENLFEGKSQCKPVLDIIQLINNSEQLIKNEKHPRKLSIVQETSSLNQWHSNRLSDHLEKEEINLHDMFDFTDKSSPYIRKDILKVRHKLEYQWSQVSPLQIKNIGSCRQMVKIIESKKMFIFMGLIDKNLIGQKSSWKKQGTIGCFLYNSRVYYNGEHMKRKGQVSKFLAQEGQTVQISLNRLFKQIIWLVDGHQKIKLILPEFFGSAYKQFVPYIELFVEGDTVNFICQPL